MWMDVGSAFHSSPFKHPSTYPCWRSQHTQTHTHALYLRPGAWQVALLSALPPTLPWDIIYNFRTREERKTQWLSKDWVTWNLVLIKRLTKLIAEVEKVNWLICEENSHPPHPPRITGPIAKPPVEQRTFGEPREGEAHALLLTSGTQTHSIQYIPQRSRLGTCRSTEDRLWTYTVWQAHKVRSGKPSTFQTDKRKST